MTFWTPSGLLHAAAGRWLVPPADPARPLPALSIDSRTLRPGEAFLALRGDRFDGHDFLPAAVSAGAGLLIVDREPPAAGLSPPGGVMLVSDTRAALLRLGAAWRGAFQGVRVVAVTGSNGKTTTVRLIDAVLSARYRGVASVKSFNNDIGVPLTLLRVRPGDEYVVCEVGMNAPGEIAPLAAAIRPDAAVITSIGRAHIEALGSVEAIAREKASLLRGLARGGVAVVSAGERHLEPYVKGLARVATFGPAAGAGVRVVNIRHGPVGESVGVRFEVEGAGEFALPAIGLHNASNAAAAIAVGRLMGVDDEAIRSALATFAPAEMRLQRRTVGEVDVFNDAYNANPDSMAAALGAFVELAASARRRVFVMGEMREMGAHAAAAHDEVAQAVLSLDKPMPGRGRIDIVVTVGAGADPAAERLTAAWGPDRVRRTKDAEAAAALVASLVGPGDAALLKGSRAVGLERVEAALRGGAGRDETRATPACSTT